MEKKELFHYLSHFALFEFMPRSFSTPWDRRRVSPLEVDVGKAQGTYACSLLREQIWAGSDDTISWADNAETLASYFINIV